MDQVPKLTQSFVRREIRVSGRHDDVIKYPLDVEEDDNAANKNGDQRPDDMPAQFLDVIDKGHIGRGAILSFAEEFVYDAHFKRLQAAKLVN